MKISFALIKTDMEKNIQRIEDEETRLELLDFLGDLESAHIDEVNAAFDDGLAEGEAGLH